MEEEAKRHSLKSQKIQNRTCGAPNLGKTYEKANHTKAPNQLADQKFTTTKKPQILPESDAPDAP